MDNNFDFENYQLPEVDDWINQLFDDIKRNQDEKENRRNESLQEKLQPKQKRNRTIFTPYQLFVLEEQYKRERYLDKTTRSILSSNLNLSEGCLKVWFQNRRMKDKRNGYTGQRENCQQTLPSTNYNFNNQQHYFHCQDQQQQLYYMQPQQSAVVYNDYYMPHQHQIN